MEIILDMTITVAVTTPANMTEQEAVDWAQQHWYEVGSIVREEVQETTVR
jgi:hypothetical protein